ncbi:quercetin dioxygenase [Acrasis kona]|uniref:Quercetin dioxygenase n=1 Tax=Acrasis kona TaxID=1008807 RepID=A0AAW2ZHH8_9EUKA
MSKAILKVIRSKERGHAYHGWLDSYHTFSFANYHNPQMMGFGSLRVINEDRVTPKEGFGTHPHQEYEIYSYIVSGELEHRDSMNNVETLKRGDIQFTSAGTGISHSEYNRHSSKTVHFLQIWVKPSVSRLKPSYSTKHFSDEMKLNQLRPLVSPLGEAAGCIKINQDVHTSASILEKDKKVEFDVRENRKALLQVITTAPDVKLKVNSLGEEHVLSGGDVLLVTGTTFSDTKLEITGGSETNTEFLLFDIGK